MKIRFTFSICLQLLAVMFYMIATGDNAAGQHYYIVNAYGENDSTGYPKPLKTVFVDLDTKTIIKEITFGDEGWMLNKKPLPIEYNSDTLLVSAAMAGCFCDNAVAGVHRLELGIINPVTRNLVSSYSDSNLNLTFLEKLPDQRVFLEGETKREPKVTIRGDYTLGADYRFVLKSQRPRDYSYGLYPDLGPIKHIEPLDSNINLYGGIYLETPYIIRTDSTRTRIIDTLRLVSNNVIVDSLLPTSFPANSHIIAFADTFIYDFNLNYEFYAKFLQKPRDLGRIDSHVKIYSLSTFVLLKSSPVADYPPGDYPNEAFDAADVIGPYIVYYFFESGGIESRAPAMLFIFDTSTNQATWLRVGWR